MFSPQNYFRVFTKKQNWFSFQTLDLQISTKHEHFFPQPNQTRHSSTVSPIFAEYHRGRKKDKKAQQTSASEDEQAKPISVVMLQDHDPRTESLMYKMPEFVPTTYWGHRDSVREVLERTDLLKRRSVLKIPEFYVGSILSVTVADEVSPTKLSRFVGICIQRGEPGLYHRFTLRNVIDDQGIEIMYEMYNPMIRDITVLKLERRLDDEMTYLRDALPEYSTVPLDMKPEPRSANERVPLNETLVKMKPRPWTQRWERWGLKGVDEATIVSQLTHKMRMQRMEPTRNKTWEKYDLVLQYRNSVTREETDQIYGQMLGRDIGETEQASVVRDDDKQIVVQRKKARKIGRTAD